MSQSVIVKLKMRDDFEDDFLIAYARTVIAFGRLEATVKLAIKNLTVSMSISPDFTHGIAEAEKKRQFGLMCNYMLELHERKYGKCDEGEKLAKWVAQAKKIANETRNRIVHGAMTIDDNDKPLVLFTRLDRETKELEFHEINVSTAALNHTREVVVALWLGLHSVREAWGEQ